MNEDEMKMIELYRRLSPADKNLAFNLISRLAADDVKNFRRDENIILFNNDIAIGKISGVNDNGLA